MSNRALTNDDIKLLNETFASKDEVRAIVKDELKQIVGTLPTKDEFASSMSELMGEVKAVREEIAVHEHQHRVINDRLGVIEPKLGIVSP